MKERPILFSAHMVIALLEGRKSMTRRAVKPQPPSYAGLYLEKRGNEFIGYMPPGEQIFGPSFICPYGIPGDRLWVKEACWMYGHWTLNGKTKTGRKKFRFVAGSANLVRFDKPDTTIKRGCVHYDGWVYRHARFMPRWASRILLEITDVMVERLQEISPEDAEAEGLKAITKDGKLVKYGIPDKDGLPGQDDIGWPWHLWRISPVDAYEALWESINGPGSWEANPWVWVVCFKRVK